MTKRFAVEDNYGTILCDLEQHRPIYLLPERSSQAFTSWLTATLVYRSSAAVNAAVTLECSNGQIEGQIKRLNLVKRQMYGRADFDLLKARYLHAG